MFLDFLMHPYVEANVLFGIKLNYQSAIPSQCKTPIPA